MTDSPKKRAAYRAVELEIKPSHKYIGVGTGTTVKYVIEALSKLKNIQNYQFIPTSLETHLLLLESNLQIAPFDKCVEIDVAIDGADEVDSQLNCVKGGGAALLTEKIVAYYSKRFVIVADSSKQSTNLFDKWEKGIPVEVITSALTLVREKLNRMEYKCAIRKSEGGKIGPVVTDSGNCIIDIKPNENSKTPKEMELEIKMIPGVVEVGLFCGIASAAYFGQDNGEEVSMLVK